MEIVRPRKAFGQHFLHDENIARKIISSLNPEIPRVLEIGPGKGILSKFLLDNPAFDPWFIEIDPASVAFLRERYPAICERLMEGDFLRLDLEEFFRAQVYKATTGNRQPATGIQLVGNFPYNISSQILFRVLDNRFLVKEVTGMFQREVARRIASPPGTREYGILSVLIQAFYDITYLFTVNESVFSPPPNVKSAVIRLRRNAVDHLGCRENLWMQVVKTAFNQRRKILRNSLKRLSATGFAGRDESLLNLRPEQLSGEDFIILTRMLEEEKAENF